MANLTEVDEFTAGVYQLETTDPVLGGAGGISNSQAQALANRTTNLKGRLDDLSAENIPMSGSDPTTIAAQLAAATTQTFSFEASGEYPQTFTNIGPVFVAPFDLKITGVDLVVEKNGSGGGYSEFDVVQGASGAAPASILANKPRVPGNGGAWGKSGVTASSQAATLTDGTTVYPAGTIFSVNITSGANHPPITDPVSATVAIRFIPG